MHISPAHFFRFRFTLKINGNSHEKKIKIFIFSKIAPTIFIKFCGFLVHLNLNNMTLSAIHGKSFKLKNNHFLIFYPSPSLATKPIDLVQIRYLGSACKYIQPVFFLFRPTIESKGSLLKKQANGLSDKHGILQTCSILFLLLCY